MKNITTVAEAKAEQIFVIENNEIVQTNLFEHVMASAEETTSPRGVESKLHIRENEEKGTFELWTWGFRGQFPKFIESFENEEDAENSIFQRTFEYDFSKDNQRSTYYYSTFEEAVNDWAENNEMPVNVAISYLQHAEKLNKLKAERAAKWQREANEKKEALQSAVKKEASEIIKNHSKILPEFQKQVSEIKSSAIKGENKSKELSDVFQKFIKISGLEKITSDYWQVFRILTAHK